MKTIFRIIELSLALIIVFSACACGQATTQGSQTTTPAATASETTTTAAQISATAAGNQSNTQAVVTSNQADTGLELTEDGVTARGVFPVVTEPYTMTIAMPIYPNVEDIDTNYTTLVMEELTGINLEFIQMPSTPADLATKVNLMFASNDLPDCFVMEYPGFEMPAATLWEAALAKQIVPLDKYIEKYGEGFDSAIEYLGPEKAAYVNSILTFPDGHKYTYAYMNNVDIDIYCLMTWVYIPWLEEAGLETPKTLDDFYNMALVFKNRGPNITPISAAKEQANRFIAYIGNCFQYTDFTWRLKVENGVVEFIANNDEYRQTLEFINKLYVEKLLDPLIFTQSTAEFKARLAQNELTVGIINHQSPSAYMDTTTEPMLDFHIIDALEGPTGLKLTMDRGMQVNHTFWVTSKCEIPAAAVRFADYFITEEGRFVGSGVQGVDWDWGDPGATDILGNQAYYKVYNVYGALPSQNMGWWIGPTKIMDWRYSARQNDDKNPRDYESKKSIGADMLKKSAPKEYVPNAVKFENEDDQKIVTQLRADITNYVEEMSALFILGDLPFSEWDRYVDEVNSLGVEEYVRLMQISYNMLQ
ncbi:MAG: extracellular solute-binding protein [Oscillospiraceae bacterium]|nr:extracellular solute-binding protein [Oscillospiraceae bacterium]